MKINKLKLLLVVTFLLFSLFNYSQKLKEDRKSLPDILVEIEKEYQVTFTYANKILENVEILAPAKELGLTNTIQYLEEKTFLKFTQLTSSNILISAKNSSENICGYLFDVNIKKHIKGAHISVLNTNINTTSNDVGFFSISTLNENQIIQISHIGYPTLYLNSTDFLMNKECLTISLAEKIEELNEVILQNYLTTGIKIKTDNSYVISPKNFGILPGLIEPDILHQIQALPGISSVNETISDINIRGGTNDQNLLLWDGIKMYHSGHFFGLISAFNPYLTDSVTVIKNGTNAQFNDGVSGTIAIESVDEINEKPLGGAGFNMLSIDAYAQIPVSKKVAFQVSGRRSTTDLFYTPTFEQYFKRAFQDTKISTELIAEDENVTTDSDFNFYDFSAKILYNIHKNHHFRFSLLNVENNLFYNESLFSETMEDSKTSSLKQRNLAFGFQLTDRWSPNFKTEFHGYFTKYNIDASNYTLLTEQRLLQKNEVLETGLKLNTFYEISEKIKLLSGYHYYELGITNAEDVNLPTYIRTIKKVLRNHSLYSTLSYVSRNNKTVINGGLRLNYIEKFETFLLEPRFQLFQKLNNNFSFKIAGEFKSQNATQIIDLQEDFLGVEKRRWVLADNETIPIIKSKQASVGFNFKKAAFFIDLEGFYKYVDGITTANQGFQNQNQFIKTSGSYTVSGLEFLINRKTEVFSTWLGYTYNNNNYNFQELSPNDFPNNLDIKHRISFGNTYTYNSFKFAFGLLWRTGKPHTTPLEEEPVNNEGFISYINYNDPNGDRLSNYFRADFSSTYNFNFSKNVCGLVGFSILNLLNTENILNTYYKIDSEDTIHTIHNTSIGTTPNVTFRVSF